MIGGPRWKPHGNDGCSQAESRIDWAGALVLASWLVALLLGLSEGETWGWSSPRIVGLFAAAAVLGLV